MLTKQSYLDLLQKLNILNDFNKKKKNLEYNLLLINQKWNNFSRIGLFTIEQLKYYLHCIEQKIQYYKNGIGKTYHLI